MVCLHNQDFSIGTMACAVVGTFIASTSAKQVFLNVPLEIHWKSNIKCFFFQIVQIDCTQILGRLKPKGFSSSTDVVGRNL